LRTDLKLLASTNDGLKSLVEKRDDEKTPEAPGCKDKSLTVADLDEGGV